MEGKTWGYRREKYERDEKYWRRIVVPARNIVKHPLFPRRGVEATRFWNYATLNETCCSNKNVVGITTISISIQLNSFRIERAHGLCKMPKYLLFSSVAEMLVLLLAMHTPHWNLKWVGSSFLYQPYTIGPNALVLASSITHSRAKKNLLFSSFFSHRKFIEKLSTRKWLYVWIELNGGPRISIFNEMGWGAE